MINRNLSLGRYIVPLVGIMIIFSTSFFCALCPAENGPQNEIFFLGYRNNNWMISSVVPDGTGETRLGIVPKSVKNFSVAWQSDKLVLLDDQQNMFFLDLESGKTSPLDVGLEGINDFEISGDGNRLLFSLSTAGSIDANDIWIVNLEKHIRRQLTHMKNMQHDPAWSHDENRIVFASGAGGQDHDLFVLDLKTGAGRQLTAGQRYHFEPACSVNDEIAFSSNQTGDYEIWVCDFEGKRFEQITRSAGLDGQPTWSPDGKQIAFMSVRGGYPAIWIINRDGTNAHQVSPAKIRARKPIWNR